MWSDYFYEPYCLDGFRNRSPENPLLIQKNITKLLKSSVHSNEADQFCWKIFLVVYTLSNNQSSTLTCQ